MTTVDFAAFVEKLANIAAETILPFFRTALHADDKNAGGMFDPVTEADRAADIEYWPTADPTTVEGSREARLAAYREVRNTLARRIAERFGAPLPAPIDLAPRDAL